MAYSKQTWVTGDVITAEKLNHMEDGIASSDDYDLELDFNFYNDAETGLISNATGEGIGASFSALCDKILSGVPLKVKIIESQYTGTDLSTKRPCVSQTGSYNAYDDYVPTPGVSLSFFDLNFTISSTDILFGGAVFSYVYDATTKEYTITYTPE